MENNWNLHDATLIGVIVNWPEGSVIVNIIASILSSTKAVISVEQFCSLRCPRLQEWGASVSINEITGPYENDKDSYQLDIEMQSGDVISLVGRRITIQLQEN